MEEFLNGKWLEMENEGICYRKFKPGYPVNNYVEHFLVCKGIPEFAYERLFPSNRVEIFFNLGDPNRGVWGSANYYDFKQTIVSGLRSSCVKILPGKLFYVVGMRFNLYGFYHLFGMPGYEITDGNFSAVDVLGKEMGQLWQELGDSNDPILLIRKMYDWIMKKIRKCDTIPNAWQRIDSLLKTTQSNIKSELPQLLGYSYKHSLKTFCHICGLHPKIIQRIYRVNNLLSNGEILSNPNWAGLSYQFGFSDQSHLIKEFREFTGFTPAEFLTGRPKDFLLKQLR
jgi:AraC-like DNA-binding protein